MKLEHTGLVVKDLDKQLTFYRDILGLKVTREAERTSPPSGSHTGVAGVRRKLVFLAGDGGDFQLELIHYIDPVSPPGNTLAQNQCGSTHLCFQTENLEQRYEELLRQGVGFLTPPRLTQGNRSRLCYAQDPEGNWIEFKEELIKQ
jgi:catechol 2,3-dioxygenase-like lactoylglutathione lyase family enzyme